MEDVDIFVRPQSSVQGSTLRASSIIDVDSTAMRMSQKQVRGE